MITIFPCIYSNESGLLVSDPLLACWCTTCHLPKYPDLNSGCLGLSMIELMTFMTSLLLIWKKTFCKAVVNRTNQLLVDPIHDVPQRGSQSLLQQHYAKNHTEAGILQSDATLRRHVWWWTDLGNYPPYVTVEVTRDDFPGKPPNFRGFSIVTFDYNRVSQIDLNWWNFPGWWIRMIYRGTKMDGHSLPVKTICGWISAWTFDQGPSYGLTC